MTGHQTNTFPTFSTVIEETQLKDVVTTVIITRGKWKIYSAVFILSLVRV